MKKFAWILFFITIGIVHNISALSIWDKDPYEIRNQINQQIMSVEAPTPIVKNILNKTIKNNFRSTPIRIYTPIEKNNSSVILLIHGGAWVAGNLDTHDNLARYLCSKTNTIVVSVDYLTSPEGKFPLPMEQCYDALTWINEESKIFPKDSAKITVVGDSAGGNMAAALCIMTRDRNGPKISLQVLINPAPDLTCNGTLERKDDSLDVMRWQAVQYLSNLNDANHPYVSPLVAKDLSNLPKAVILLAEKDQLRESGQKYANKLILADVPTQTFCQKDIGHLAGNGARASLLARESLDVAIKAIRDELKCNGIH
jgi:acetyl esterase